MALISLQNIQIAFGGPKLLDGVTLQIESGERICLIGRNGEGKSTLLKIVDGTLEPDDGTVIRSGVRVARLQQTVPQDIEGTVFDLVSRDWNHEHALDHPVEKVISLMNLEPNQPFAELSGGMRRRALLAKALVNEPDILVLDEPTNHLDIDSIQWLENFLARWRGTVLFVTHDRVFLQKLATRIVELDRGQLTSWECDYETYLKRRQALLDAEEGQWAEFDRKLAQEEVWIRKGIKARRTRNEGRVRELEKMRAERSQRRERSGTVKLQLHEAEQSGRKVITVDHISCSYEGEDLISGFSTEILRGDRIGIIGPNGCGKTTLINTMLGTLAPTAGEVRNGTRLEVAYFDQHRQKLDENKSVKWNLCADNEYVQTPSGRQHVMGYLRNFLFSPADADQPVGSLSGGERNRLMLAKLFAQPSNVLVLDEPTNDLDVETLDMLEEMLAEYQGTVLLVSHDRAFLNNVVTSTIVFEENGLGEYAGGYDDWVQQSSYRKESAEMVQKTTEPQKTRTRKLTNKERYELKELPKTIEALEAELETLTATLNDPDFYRRDPEEIRKTTERAEAVPKELEAAYERWAELEEHS
ncbi:ATP-binding cassette domain-containing protein [Tichowtungia aerotolerans]|uniref:ATP-binding protein Uup n=1 Tax=Tichowtungia aerotolerans TaxID=2697043 RepID=A0A6P1M1Y1_9BACT|nr:ATP-binding cassette domain-containing protein [Tichowtungia aerotolerans]QHI68829.1 ATP-binding cassette domain-containing protein [Tichowtungia aerotolerans]